LGSTSSPSADPCEDLLGVCLRGEAWSKELLDRSLAVDEGRAFLSIVVERLGDLFERRLCDVYDRLFSEVIARVAPDLMPRVRPAPKTGAPPASADRVYVLSRVTLGADVAVTSVLMDAVKQRYSEAEIAFVGSRKSYELFEADQRVRHFPAPYARSGSLRDRLAASASLWFDDGIVIDPDSRFTQLGLLSVSDDRNYFLFPSRSYSCEGSERLPDVAACWAQEVFGVRNAKPYVAPTVSGSEPAEITVSLGVGGNESKRIGGDFECQLLRMLAGTGKSVIVDKGGDDAERRRVENALSPGVRTHDGSFAAFASLIQRSRLFVGYDSAGGHVASACGVPLIGIAKGFASDRMAARWRPKGTVIDGNSADVLARIQNAAIF
jgi:Glycosyltransferase family 9 (heptosyltransferase)